MNQLTRFFSIATVAIATLLAALPAASESQRADSRSDASGAPFVASVRGRVYYWTGCDAWKQIAVANRRYFQSRAEAERAGYSVSRARGCAGPGAPAPAATSTPSRSSAATPRATSRATCVITRVVDGDTFVCTGDVHVRLLLIDTPERGQGDIGAVATAALRRLAPVGSKVGLEFDVQSRDRYGRLLAYAYDSTGRMINEQLVREGVALVGVYPPNVRYVDRFRLVSDSARAARRGLWARDAFECSPADYRRGRCR